jgi:zinc protease
MHRAVALALLLALVAIPVQAVAGPALDVRLPSDPRLVTGRLDNGLTYVIRRHPTAERRVGVWLHVASGSLNETEATRGLAHYLEHLAFNGSANFPPGSLVPFFESLGLTFGRDQNAFTSFDQTTYQIMVPAGKPDVLDKALLFMADVAGRLDLSAEEIDGERRIILEEKRARAGAGQRVQDLVLERLAPGSTLGRRLPIGTEPTILGLRRADFLDYYRRWYVPANMTVIVAGDCDPTDVAARIARQFGSLPAGARPEPRPVGVQATAGTRAIVATDAELTRADVSLIRVGPPRQPSTTVGDFRRDLVEWIGTWIAGRRLDAASAQGRARFETASATLDQWAGAVRTATVRASGRPEAWRELLSDLGQILQQARLHGFGPREVEQARAGLLAQARETVSRDATTPVRAVLSSIHHAVTDREPVLSPAQRLALLEHLLPDITPSEVSAAFAAAFDPSDVVVVATLPAAGATPAEAEVAHAGRAAVDVRPAAISERPAPASLLASPPAAGTIVDETTDATSHVTSVWLDNGVRGHHRRMEQRRGEVIVSVTLAGGAIEENATSRGLTEAAAQAWASPATSRLTSTDVQDLLVGKRISLHPHVGEDAVTLTVRTTPGDLETALQLVHVLLTDPLVEPVALERWREASLRWITRRGLEPLHAVQHAAAEALTPATEPRMRPLGREAVAAVTATAAQAWLRRLVAVAPLEAAIVGDVQRADALGVLARYLGALPARPRIDAGTLAALRRVAPPGGPIRVTRRLVTGTPQAAVVAGFRGADVGNRRDVRMLNLAARVLSSRMYRALREERQLVYSIGALSRPGVAYPGFGTFVAQAPTDPERAQALVGAVEAMYVHFAAEGPTEAEVGVARHQLIAQLDQQLQRPEFWAARLATSEYRGERPAEALEARPDYEGARPQDVHDAFRRYWQPGSRFTILITPAPRPAAGIPGDEPAPPPGVQSSPRDEAIAVPGSRTPPVGTPHRQ